MNFAAKLTAALVAAVILLPGQAAHALLAAQHTGSTVPTTEGWTPSAGTPPSGQTVGPITDGATAAWFVDDASGDLGSAYFYSDVLSSPEAASASTIGWTLSATLRVPSTGNPAGYSEYYSPFINYYDGDRYWWLGFDNSGPDTRVQTVTFFPTLSASQGPVFTVPGGVSTYNTYTLQKAPDSLTANFYINGVLQSSTYAGAVEADQPPVVQWGTGSSLDSGRGHFSSVTFDVAPVPEARSWLLVGGAACVALCARRIRAGRMTEALRSTAPGVSLRSSAPGVSLRSSPPGVSLRSTPG